MRLKSIWKIAPIFMVIIFSLELSGQDREYCFPLKEKMRVSGSFAELRSNHFHSGIDLSTSGVIGKRVYSIDSGYVSRIATSPYGYGRALYITHPDGITSVYGHLDGFSSKIDSLLFARQKIEKSFTMNIMLTPDELPVERGEVVAFSGNSGSSGGPHLHFEVRDTEAETPRLPLKYVNVAPDNSPPTINAIYVVPLNDSSYVDGPGRYYRRDCIKQTDGTFKLKSGSALRGYGSIGIAFQVVDKFGSGWSKCGIVKAALVVDSESVEKSDTLYSYDIEKFSFDESRYLNAHIIYPESKRSGRRVHRMHKLPGNFLSIYRSNIDDGAINIDSPSDLLPLKLIVEDESGNRSVAKFKLTYRPKIEKRTASKVSESIMRYDQDNFYEFKTEGETRLSLELPKGALYEDYDLVAKRSKSAAPFSPLYAIGSREIPIHRYSTLSIVPENLPTDLQDKVLIVDMSKAGRFSSAGGSFKDGVVETRIRAFGCFGVGVDTIAPRISPKWNLSTKSVKGRYLNIKISDNLSGVKDYSVEIGGRWMLAEYDGKSATLKVDLKKMEVSAGEHSIEIEVSDGKDNISIWTGTVKV